MSRVGSRVESSFDRTARRESLNQVSMPSPSACAAYLPGVQSGSAGWARSDRFGSRIWGLRFRVVGHFLFGVAVKDPYYKNWLNEKRNGAFACSARCSHVCGSQRPTLHSDKFPVRSGSHSSLLDARKRSLNFACHPERSQSDITQG